MNRPNWRKNRLFLYVAATGAIGLLISAGALSLLHKSDFDYSSIKCQATDDDKNSKALTAQQLTDILLIPERSKLTDSVRSVLPAPACSLPDIEMRPGAVVKRMAYRLAFRRQAILIIGTEGNEYIGFKIRGLKEGAVTILTDSSMSISQNWRIKIGDNFRGATVIGSLGQVSLRLNGRSVVAPADGIATQIAGGCIRFDALDIPGYVMQFCGLNADYKDKLINQGEPIGSGSIVLVGVLRRQVNGTWAFVEPAPSAIEAVIR